MRGDKECRSVLRRCRRTGEQPELPGPFDATVLLARLAAGAGGHR
ncbi:hypothetical protein [Kitasatospora sp. NPDC097643]